MIFNTDYIILICFLALSFIVALLLTGASYILAGRQQISDLEKISAYECGFDPFEDTRIEFDIRFYLVSILFIIFDLEIMFLFPWSLALTHFGFAEIMAMMQFVIVLSVGFIYEWAKGALEWA
jgi:NADH-quinone oxidoreductase subunit A